MSDICLAIYKYQSEQLVYSSDVMRTGIKHLGWDAKMKDHGSEQIAEFDPDVESWMRVHTIGDLRNLAASMESKGVDASEVNEFINELCSVST